MLPIDVRMKSHSMLMSSNFRNYANLTEGDTTEQNLDSKQLSDKGSVVLKPLEKFRNQKFMANFSD
jgi:hypothetical protein